MCSLFKQLAKKYQRMTGKLKTTPTATPTSTPVTPEADNVFREAVDHVSVRERERDQRERGGEGREKK